MNVCDSAVEPGKHHDPSTDANTFLLNVHNHARTAATQPWWHHKEYVDCKYFRRSRSTEDFILN